jgi:SNF2 family DNA or RNA helicase
LFDKKPANYQEASILRCVNDRKHFVFYRMGLGKTVVGTNALYRVKQETILILCPKNAIRTWEDHINEWFAGLDSLCGEKVPFAIWRWRKKYNSADKRRALWQNRVPNAMNIYIMTFAGYISDFEHFPHQPHVVIVDEAKRIRGRKGKAFELLKKHCKHARYFWPMTGTPGKLPKDTWTLFHLAEPQRFSSYWKFVNAFHYVMRNEFGQQEILAVRNEEQWYRTLKAKSSIVTKEMVKDQIGASEKRRQRLFVEMDDIQAKLYKQLQDEMMAVTDDDIIFAQTSLTRTLKFRQLLICPKILSPSIQSYGSALEDLVETLSETDPHVVIFTPFTAAFPFIAERLKAAGHQHVGFLSGGITPDEQVARIEAFRRSRGIMVCSILYAQSFSLEPAAEAFFLGYEFDPEDNAQAEDRLQRFTTNYPINIYYYAYEDTYDDRVSEIVCIKHQQYNKTFDPSKAGLVF